jgi:1,4-alpha-glucan branching enzyme
MDSIKQLAIIQEDPWLAPYQQEIKERLENFQKALKEIEDAEGSLLNFASAHQHYGIHFDDQKNGWI